MGSARASTNIPLSLRKIWHDLDNSKNIDDLPDMAAVVESTRAIVSRDTLDKGGWNLETVAIRKPGQGELLVEIVATGICHTDVLVGNSAVGESPLALYPRVLGHEGSGYVRAVGPGVTVAQVGDPVLLSYSFCNKCAICEAGRHSHCPEFVKLNFLGPYDVFGKQGSSEYDVSGHFFGQSSFANHTIVRDVSVVNVKGIVKDKQELQLFAPLGCGIQTGSGTVINAAKATSSDAVVVMGLGGVGLSSIMGAALSKCRTIIGIDRVESRLKLAEQLGATATINGATLGDKSLIDAVRELTEGQGPTVTIDTTGVPALIEAGVEFTRNRGRICQVGSSPVGYELKIDLFSFMLSGKQLLGAIEGQAYPPDYVPQMIQWYREGRFPIDKLFKLMPVNDFLQGLHEMHQGTTIKPILCWS